MVTLHDTSILWTDRLPAQVAAVLAMLCAVTAVFWDSGLQSFLLALVGLVLSVASVLLTVDGWLFGEVGE